MEKAYLVFSNGRVFEGTRFGAAEDTVGEKKKSIKLKKLALK